MVVSLPDEAAGRRTAIIEAAARVIARRGYEGARLADVADEAGVSIGLVQHYFRSRERLMAETFRDYNAALVASALELADAEPDPSRRLVKLVRFTCSDSPRLSLEEEWALWLEFWLTATRVPALRDQSAEIEDGWQRVFADAIAEGVRAGVFRPSQPVDDVVADVLAMMDGLMIRSLLGHPGVTPERVEALLLAYLSEALQAKLKTTNR
jgi:AcrR family transcriptional regulator